MAKTDLKSAVELFIDKKSLTDLQKQLLKETFKINVDVNVAGSKTLGQLTNDLSALIKSTESASKGLSLLPGNALNAFNSVAAVVRSFDTIKNFQTSFGQNLA